MKRVVLGLVAVLFLVTALPAFAARGEDKGADQKAYEHASDESIFNRTGDWFATIGKSKEEKQKIKAERKTKRAAKRAEKKAMKKKKDTEREARKAEKKAEKAKRNAEKAAHKAKDKVKKAKEDLGDEVKSWKDKKKGKGKGRSW
ncbi:MAG: hypothetical protein P9M13_00605 [Candidatus Ancaeobacter aquaticus]|nr:hypothetical protein [Candidatus Ancaeobacter aquaticus]